MPKAILAQDFDVKVRLIRSRSPRLDPHVTVFVDGWQIAGYATETSDVPVIVINEKTFQDAERRYYAAYDRLVESESKLLLVGRSQPDPRDPLTEAKQ